MAELNLDYYTAKDHYSDGDIEETLLKMAQEGKSFEDLPEEEVSFPMVYHFSGLRENILSWYPLKKADSVLEIGAGCGAITGMLCRKAGHVTSVELSKRRADINYARNRDKENLTLMVGNLNDMTSGKIRLCGSKRCAGVCHELYRGKNSLRDISSAYGRLSEAGGKTSDRH